MNPGKPSFPPAASADGYSSRPRWSGRKPVPVGDEIEVLPLSQRGSERRTFCHDCGLRPRPTQRDHAEMLPQTAPILRRHRPARKNAAPVRPRPRGRRRHRAGTNDRVRGRANPISKKSPIQAVSALRTQSQFMGSGSDRQPRECRLGSIVSGRRKGLRFMLYQSRPSASSTFPFLLSLLYRRGHTSEQKEASVTDDG